MPAATDRSSLPTRPAPLPIPGRAFVYILVCAEGALYIGSTTDIFRRVGQHGGANGAKFTRDHGMARLVYTEGPFIPAEAISRERQLKRWRRAKKLALIRGEKENLKRLSRSRRAPA